MKHPLSDQLHHFFDAGYDLIPLNQAHAIGKNGKKIGKAPVGRDWRNKPPLSLEEAKAHMLSGGNVGIRLKRHDLVIDVDPRNFEHDINSFDALLNTYPELEPFTMGLSRVAVETGGRTDNGDPGYHFYFRLRLPKDWDERDRLRSGLKDFPGIEFKSKGTQVLAIGSVHPDTGLYYEWALANDMLPDMDQIPEVPDELFRDLWKHPASQGPLMEGADWTPEMLAEFLAELDPVDYRDHDKWLNLMMACHSATLGDGVSEFIDWSIGDDLYAFDGDHIAYRWDTLDVDGDVTVKTLEFIAQQKKIAVPRRPDADFADTVDEDTKMEGKPSGLIAREDGLDLEGVKEKRRGDGLPQDSFNTALSLLNQLQPRLRVGYNQLKHRTEFRSRDLPWAHFSKKSLLDDNTLQLLRAFIIQQFHGVEISTTNLNDALQVVSSMNSFHPIVDYLDGLQWDGKPRVESMLADMFGAEDSEYVRAVSELMLVAAVRRARQPGCKFDCMPILEGKQGTGKSSGLRALCPDETWFNDNPLPLNSNADNTKAVIVLEGAWIYEMAELEAMARSKMKTEGLKAHVTRQVDVIKRPYDRHPTEIPRSYVMIGTTNDKGYLTDLTGNRRYLPVQTTTINVEAVIRERDQLWAEAVALEKKYGALHLPVVLWDMAAAEQLGRLIADPWLDELIPYLEGTAGGDENDPPVKRDRVLARQLLNQLGFNNGRADVNQAIRLRRVMEACGWEYKSGIRTEGGRGSGYVKVAD